MADYGFGGDINGNGRFDPGDYEIWEETMKDSSSSCSDRNMSSNVYTGGGIGSLIGNILLWILAVTLFAGMVMVGLGLLVICPPLGGLLIMGAFEMLKKM